MKMDYTAEDIGRAVLWYIEHKDHVARLVRMSGGEDYPMSGSDISRPELWQPGGWNYFFRKYYLSPPSFEAKANRTLLGRIVSWARVGDDP